MAVEPLELRLAAEVSAFVRGVRQAATALRKISRDASTAEKAVAQAMVRMQASARDASGKITASFVAVSRAATGVRGAFRDTAAAAAQSSVATRQAAGKVVASMVAVSKAATKTAAETRQAAVKVADDTRQAAAKTSEALRSIAGGSRASAARIGASLGTAGKAAGEAGRRIVAGAQQADDGFSRAAAGIRGSVLDIRTALATLGAAAVGKQAVSFAADFETSLAQVSTLLKQGDVPIQQYREQLLALSETSSKELLDLTQALYSTITAGIPAVEGAGGAFDVLNAAQKAAVAGLATTDQAVNALVTVLNAYQGKAGSASEVSDLLFRTLVRGRTTFPELASQLGDVVTNAAQFGVRIDELLAAVATLTRFGVSTPEAVTSINQAILKIVNPTDDAAKAFKALGIEVGAVALQQKGLGPILEEIAEKAGGSADALTKLFPEVRALRAVTVLAGGGLQGFRDDLQDLGRSAGSTQSAFDKISDTFNNTAAIFKSQLQATLVAAGERVLPRLRKVIEDIGNYLVTNREAIGQTFERVVNALVSIGQFVASQGQAIITFLVTSFAVSRIAAATQALRGFTSALQEAVAKAAAGEAAGGKFVGGFQAAAKSLPGLLAGLLKSPTALGAFVAAAVTIGQVIGDAIGRFMTDSIRAAGERARQEADRAAAALAKALRDRGFSDLDELSRLQEGVRRGQVVKLGKENRREAFVTPEDLVKDASPEVVQSVLQRRQAEVARDVRKLQEDASAASLRELKARQRSADAARRGKGAAAASAEAEAESARAAGEAAAAKAEELQAGLATLSERVLNAQLAKEEAAEGERAAAAARDKLKAEEAAKKAVAARRAREREAQQAAERFARAQAAAQTEGAAAEEALLSGLEAQIELRRRALELAEEAAEAERERLDEIGAGQALLAAAAAADRANTEASIALLEDEIRLAQARLDFAIRSAESEARTRDAAQARLIAESAAFASLEDREQALATFREAAAARLREEITQLQTEALGQVIELDRALAAARERAFGAGVPEGVSRVFDELGRTAQEAISAAFDVEPTLLERLVQAGRDFGREAETRLKTAAEVAVGVLKQGGQLFADLFTGSVVGFTDSLAEAAGVFRSTLGETFSPTKAGKAGGEVLAAPIKEAFNDFASGLNQALIAPLNAVLGPGLATALGPLLGLPAALLALGPEGLKNIERSIGPLVDGLVSTIDVLADRIGPLVQSVIGAIIEALPRVFDAIINAVPSIIVAVVNGLTLIVQALPGLASSFVQSLIGAVPEIVVAIVATFPRLVAELIAAAVRLIPELLTGIFKGLKEAVLQIFSTDFVKAVAGGIVDAILSLLPGGNIDVDFDPTAPPVTQARQKGEGVTRRVVSGPAGFFHNGGVVRGGSDALGAMRLALAGAPRFALGGIVERPDALARRRMSQILSGDDVPALLQRGEGVLSRRGMEAIGGEGALARANAGQSVGTPAALEARIITRPGVPADLARFVIDTVEVGMRSPTGQVRRALDRSQRGSILMQRFVRGRG